MNPFVLISRQPLIITFSSTPGEEIVVGSAGSGRTPGSLAPGGWTQRLTIGGYGETHLNMREGPGGDSIDNHRYVGYLGYEFTDWIHLQSEVEIEHSFVADGDGEISIEQLYTDFLLVPELNLRVGRVLVPVGIVNQRHEPTTFNGVERPSFAKYIIPTTWSSDGIGIFGNLSPELDYQAYVVGGLDGSGFSSSGIRGGRIKERTSLNDVAFTGRLDYYPWAQVSRDNNESLRFGLSAYAGGLDNGNLAVVQIQTD